MNNIFLCVERDSDSEYQILNVAYVYILRELIVNLIFLCVEIASEKGARWCLCLYIAGTDSESYLSVHRECL